MSDKQTAPDGPYEPALIISDNLIREVKKSKWFRGNAKYILDDPEAMLAAGYVPVAEVAKARQQALKEAAYKAKYACLVPPDGGSPTEIEADICDKAEKAILTLMDTKETGQ